LKGKVIMNSFIMLHIVVLHVIPVLLGESACVRTSEARRESFIEKDSGQAGMTENGI